MALTVFTRVGDPGTSDGWRNEDATATRSPSCSPSGAARPIRPPFMRPDGHLPITGNSKPIRSSCRSMLSYGEPLAQALVKMDRRHGGTNRHRPRPCGLRGSTPHPAARFVRPAVHHPPPPRHVRRACTPKPAPASPMAEASVLLVRHATTTGVCSGGGELAHARRLPRRAIACDVARSMPAARHGAAVAMPSPASSLRGGSSASRPALDYVWVTVNATASVGRSQPYPFILDLVLLVPSCCAPAVVMMASSMPAGADRSSPRND